MGRPRQAGRQDHHAQPGLVRLGEVEHPRRLGARARPSGGRRRGARPSSPRSSTTPSPCRAAVATRWPSFLGGQRRRPALLRERVDPGRAAGDDVDYIVPDDTLLIQNPAAADQGRLDRRQGLPELPAQRGRPDRLRQGRLPPGRRRGSTWTSPGANDPSNPFPAVEDAVHDRQDFGGWDEANTKFFDETTGIVTKMIAGLHVGS